MQELLNIATKYVKPFAMECVREFGRGIAQEIMREMSIPAHAQPQKETAQPPKDEPKPQPLPWEQTFKKRHRQRRGGICKI